jgi:hypothetical protein
VLFCVVFVHCHTAQVAEKLMIMHEECLEGNFKSIENLRKVSAHHVIQVIIYRTLG